MRLQDLKKHLPDQTVKINQFINRPTCFANFVEEENDPSWATFRNSIWGNASALAPLEGQRELEALQEVGMDVDVEAEGDGELPSKAVPSTQPVVTLPKTLPDAWGFDSSHVLVRSEYEEAEQAALAAIARNTNAFLVFGQSGIGKSLFLVWLLIKRLALRLPTALQVRDSEAVLFHEGGTSVFQDLVNNIVYQGLGSNNPSGRIWVLVDSNNALPKPTPVFCMGSPFFVVEAASRRSRLEWGKKVYSRYFCMKTWAFSEVLQIRPFLGLSHGGPHNESELRYLYDNYRASPRALAFYAPVPEEFEDLVVTHVQEMRPDALRYTLQTPDSDESSHLITRTEPSSTSRSLAKKTIASPGVFKLIWNQFLKLRVSDTAYYYDIFQQGGSVTASAPGWIFEFRMHYLLRQGYLINLFPLGRNTNRGRKFDVYGDYAESHSGGNATTFPLAASSEYPLDGGTNLHVDQYYRPDASNFPTIDSLLLIHPTNGPPILLMFQITRSRDGHDVKVAGLEKINGLTFPPETRKYYVAVTPLDIEPPIRVPKGCFENVHVFHHPVHPDRLFPPGVGNAGD